MQHGQSICHLAQRPPILTHFHLLAHRQIEPIYSATHPFIVVCAAESLPRSSNHRKTKVPRPFRAHFSPAHLDGHRAGRHFLRHPLYSGKRNLESETDTRYQVCLLRNMERSPRRQSIDKAGTSQYRVPPSQQGEGIYDCIVSTAGFVAEVGSYASSKRSTCSAVRVLSTPRTRQFESPRRTY